MAYKNLTHNLFRAIVLVLFLTGLLAGCKVAPDTSDDGLPSLPQPKTLSDVKWIELQKVIQAAAEGRSDVLSFMLYRVTIDDVKFSDDGTLAVVWIALVDKKTGAVQSAEPGLVICHKGTDGTWSVVFQADSNFAAELQAVPDTLLTAEDKVMYMPAIQQESKDGTVYKGYKLPWPGGQSKYLTGSIGHVYTYKSCPSTCRYAYDFADGSQFTLVAAKAGTVKYAVWKYPDGNTTNANYIILEDTTTTPTTYQVYYHLAQNSIPVALRTVGAKVKQGQFIGKVDDTGASTGNHLHFMVHTNSTSYWGTSVDIRFDEVTINNGTPRLCSEASAYPALGTGCQSKYTSQNYENLADTEAPTGAITSPAVNSVITTPELTVTGTLTDDVAVASAQLMITTDGNWTAIGDTLSGNSFSTSINLCDADIPDGSFFLSLAVTDSSGNKSADKTAMIEYTKSYACPVDPPVCTPGDNQVALTTEVNYQGTCQLLDIGDYPNFNKLDIVQNDQVSSVQVGSGVSLLLYPDKDYAGTLDFFQSGDADLSDNTIGLQNAASAKVVARIELPAAPTITIPEEVTSKTDVQFAWTTEADVTYQAALTGPDGYSSTTDWLDTGLWHVGALAAGDYELTVTAKNLAGTVAATQPFTVTEPVAPPVAALDALPEVTQSTAVKLTWQVSSGADLIDHFEIRYRLYATTDWSKWKNQPAADDRSAVFYGEMGNTYEFQIRAVAKSGDALDWGTDGETHTYLTNACVDDAFEGTDAGDDEQATAAQLTVSVEQTHNWCPADDVDWLTFQATKGQQLEFSAIPTGTDSAAVMYLYDTDGTTLLGEYHPSDANSESMLDWTVPADGIYYLKLVPGDAKTYGTEATYTVKFTAASSASTGNIVCGSITIPAVLVGALAISKSIREKKKKAAKRPGWK
jgi:murein DD-endopeptidase MepM/ murein hydrolase activator NlpD